MADFNERLDALAEMVGDNNLDGIVSVNQVLASMPDINTLGWTWSTDAAGRRSTSRNR